MKEQNARWKADLKQQNRHWLVAAGLPKNVGKVVGGVGQHNLQAVDLKKQVHRLLLADLKQELHTDLNQQQHTDGHNCTALEDNSGQYTNCTGH